MSDVKTRTGAVLVPNDPTPTQTFWDKITGTNFLASVFMLVLSIWAGNSKPLAEAGAAAVIGFLAVLHAGRTYVVTNKLDFKRWALDSNTWAAVLTIITTFVAIPADLTAALSGVVDAFNGGSLPAIVSALFYLANIVLRLLRGNSSQTPAALATVALITCATLATFDAAAQSSSTAIEYRCEQTGAIVGQITAKEKWVIWANY